MSDESAAKLKANAIVGLTMLIIGGIYHHFATNNKDMLNVLVRNKRHTSRLVRRGKGWATEHDYFIETDQGVIRDEGDLFELDAEGDEYRKVEIGHYYDFKVNHDNLTKMNNALDVKPIKTALEHAGNY